MFIVIGYDPKKGKNNYSDLFDNELDAMDEAAFNLTIGWENVEVCETIKRRN